MTSKKRPPSTRVNPGSVTRLSVAAGTWWRRRRPPRQTTGSIGWARLLGYRQTWAFIAGKALTDPVWLFYLFWLPKFLDARYGVQTQTRRHSFIASLLGIKHIVMITGDARQVAVQLERKLVRAPTLSAGIQQCQDLGPSQCQGNLRAIG